MSIDNLEDRLAKMNGAWGAADAAVGGLFEPPPDGDYQALVHAFDFFDTPKNGAFLKIELQVANDATYNGRTAESIFSLEDKDRIGFLKGVLAILGVDVENTPLTEIRPGSGTLNALLDTPVAIRIRRSDKSDKDGRPYVNVYINQRLGDPIRQGGQARPPASDVPGAKPGEFEPSRGGMVEPDQIPF